MNGGGPRDEYRKKKAETWWSAEAEKRVRAGEPRVDWSSSALVDGIINRRVTGVETRNWLGWLKERHLERPADLGLSIGCGTGLLERDAISQGLCHEMVGIDIAEGALDIARREAGDLPVKYERVDLECQALPAGEYDMVFSAGALHHINNLYFCVEQLHSCLKDDGLLVLNEYAGPSRFQWDPLQLKLVFDIYGFLPWRYRFNHLAGETIPYPRRPEICSMVMNDPSEAVRSAGMLDVVEMFFERIDRREIGGTLLNPFLSGILENFNEEDDLDSSFISTVAMLEELLMKDGVIDSDFVVDVYRRRSSPVSGDDAKSDDLARSDRILQQENAIVDGLDELGEVRAANDALRSEVGEARAQSADAGSRVSLLQSENALLKTGVVFRGARALRRVDKGRVPVEKFLPGPEATRAQSVPARVDASFGLLSAETRAIRRYLEGAGKGNEIFWLRWLREAADLSADRTLMAGLEPSCAEVAVRLGICDSVDLIDLSLLSGGARPAGSYDLILLGLHPGIEGAALAGPACGLLE
ncbi:MAG: class I SAM-dependent methyltransferase [Actinobacteria bacterium]|nr:class I SAM-dependent methyltransferase [Actinomycetota bacterium]